MQKHIENVPLALVCLFTTKLLVLNNWSFENAAVLIALTMLSGVFRLKQKSEEFSEVKERLEELQNTISRVKEQNELLKNSVASVKMAANVKTAVKF